MTDTLNNPLAGMPPAALDAPAHLERQAWEALRGSAALAEALLRGRMGAETGLSVARLEALNELAGQAEGLTMGQLARALRVSNGNATALVDGLVRDGWVLREAVPGDRRQTRVRLSETGRSGFAALQPGFRAALSDLFAGLSLSEARLLQGLLDKLRGQLLAELARQAVEGRAPAAPASPKPFGWG
jgi:DNA-binding MarR family transcriptional regulator